MFEISDVWLRCSQDFEEVEWWGDVVLVICLTILAGILVSVGLAGCSGGVDPTLALTGVGRSRWISKATATLGGVVCVAGATEKVVGCGAKGYGGAGGVVVVGVNGEGGGDAKRKGRRRGYYPLHGPSHRS